MATVELVCLVGRLKCFDHKNCEINPFSLRKITIIEYLKIKEEKPASLPISYTIIRKSAPWYHSLTINSLDIYIRWTWFPEGNAPRTAPRTQYQAKQHWNDQAIRVIPLERLVIWIICSRLLPNSSRIILSAFCSDMLFFKEGQGKKSEGKRQLHAALPQPHAATSARFPFERARWLFPSSYLSQGGPNATTDIHAKNPNYYTVKSCFIK